MLHPIVEFLDLPKQVTAAISIVGGSMFISLIGIFAQVGGQVTAFVQEAPTWFLGFVAIIVLALGWAVLVLARYAAVTQRTSNEQVTTAVSQQTVVLHELATTIALQNKFWQEAGLEMVRRAVDGELPVSDTPPNSHVRPLRTSLNPKQ